MIKCRTSEALMSLVEYLQVKSDPNWSIGKIIFYIYMFLTQIDKKNSSQFFFFWKTRMKSIHRKNWFLNWCGLKLYFQWLIFIRSPLIYFWMIWKYIVAIRVKKTSVTRPRIEKGLKIKLLHFIRDHNSCLNIPCTLSAKNGKCVPEVQVWKS